METAHDTSHRRTIRSRMNDHERRRAAPALAIAALWGFAEATVFFIVPDVWISALALRHAPGLLARCCLLAAFGAVVGGLATHQLAAHLPQLASVVLEWVPAISGEMIAAQREAFERDGYGAMALAAYTGVPYKIFAVVAGTNHAPLGPFLVASFAVRLSRFALVALIVVGARRLVGDRIGGRAQVVLLATFWLALYAVYFGTVG